MRSNDSITTVLPLFDAYGDDADLGTDGIIGEQGTLLDHRLSFRFMFAFIKEAVSRN